MIDFIAGFAAGFLIFGLLELIYALGVRSGMNKQRSLTIDKKVWNLSDEDD